MQGVSLLDLPGIPQRLGWQELRRVYEEGFPATAVVFDTEEELFWVGYGNGRLTSYLQPHMARYTSILSWTAGFQEIIPCNPGIVSVFQDRVRLHSRGCLLLAEELSLWGTLACGTLLGGHYRGQTRNAFNSTDTHVALGTTRGVLCCLDTTTSLLAVSTIQTPQGIEAMSCGRMLVAGGQDGCLRLLDNRLRSAQIQHTLESHRGPLVAVACQDDLLVSCGMMACTVNPYDSNSPPQVLNDQGSREGILALASGTSGEVIGISTSSGAVQQWGQTPACRCNVASRQTSLPPFPAPPPSRRISPHDVSPASHYALFANSAHIATGPLVSSFKRTPEVLSAAIFPPPHRQIRAELLAQATLHGFLGTFPNPVGDLPPNSLLVEPGYSACYQQDSPRIVDRVSPGKLQNAQKLVPAAYRRVSYQRGFKGQGRFEVHSYNRTLIPGLENTPAMPFLNPVLLMLYLSSPLRKAALREQFNPVHIDGKAPALATELGLLFHTLNQLPVGECIQPRNFALALQRCPEVLALGLLQKKEEQQQGLKYLSAKVQLFHRFLLSQLDKDIRSNVVDLLYGYDAITQNSFVSTELQGKSTETQSRVLVTDLIFMKTLYKIHNKKEEQKMNSSGSIEDFTRTSSFPTTDSSDEELAAQASESSCQGKEAGVLPFGSVLYSSLCRATKTRSWCEEAQTYAPIHQHRRPASLPHILALHCGECTEEAERHWGNSQGNANVKTAPWVPEIIALEFDCDGKLHVGELVNIKQQSRHWRWTCEGESADVMPNNIYRLTSMVSHITEEGNNNHLVLHTKLPQSFIAEMASSKQHGIRPEEIPKEGSWVMANDFSIHASSIDDAKFFDSCWKDPCILLYQLDSTADLELVAECTYDIPNTAELTKVFSLPSVSKALHIDQEFEPFDPLMLPRDGQIVAIDAEFVAIDLEEASIKSNGKRIINKEGQLALARFSAIDARYDLVMIDDYVIQTEPTVDYLTRFSGIAPEDLDINTSQHNLVYLRSVYLKLRFLIDQGCIFVGHGLAKDFRVMNVYVPPHQIMDTVELWSLPGQRKISLRFLASYLLSLDIQGETHDSVEDSRIALAIFRKYLEAKELNVYENTLLNLYEYGRLHDWKVGGANLRISSNSDQKGM